MHTPPPPTPRAKTSHTHVFCARHPAATGRGGRGLCAGAPGRESDQGILNPHRSAPTHANAHTHTRPPHASSARLGPLREVPTQPSFLCLPRPRSHAREREIACTRILALSITLSIVARQFNISRFLCYRQSRGRAWPLGSHSPLHLVALGLCALHLGRAPTAPQPCLPRRRRRRPCVSHPG